MNKILVTGGLGFIGSNFIRMMLEKYPQIKITNLDNMSYAGNPENLKDITTERYEFVKGDICDAEIVIQCMNNADAAVHFAAESHVDNSIHSPNIFERTNVMGTLNLLNAAKEANIQRFILVSTDEVYGSREEGHFTEEDKLNPSSPYSASKAGSEHFAMAYFKTYGLPVIITRCTNNFGPFQHPEKLIPLFITNLIKGKKVPLYGDGKNVRDWIFVQDHCNAADFVLRNGKPGEVYNIAGGNELENIEITKKILWELNGDETSIEYVQDRLGHDRRYAIDDSKLRKMGWKPAHNFAQALEKTISWYKENQEWWKKLKN